jgi:hypothetical protein
MLVLFREQEFYGFVYVVQYGGSMGDHETRKKVSYYTFHHTHQLRRLGDVRFLVEVDLNLASPTGPTI